MGKDVSEKRKEKDGKSESPEQVYEEDITMKLKLILGHLSASSFLALSRVFG